jgi:drug/metabolite transporter (DMT)-like permease
MSVQAIPYIVLLGFLFGSTLIASRFSVGQFHPTTYIGLRMVLASLGHIAIYTFGFRNRSWPRDLRLWGHAAVLGIFGTAVPMTSIVTSLQFQSAGLTAVLLTTGPAITVIMAHFFLTDESLTWRKSTGVALALGGALLLALRGENGLPDVIQASPIGYILILVAMICASIMAIYARLHMRDLDAFDVASVRMFAATLTVVPLSLLFVGLNLEAVDGQGYFALSYAALVGTFSGMLLAFYLIKRFGATTQAMSLYVTPAVAGLGGALVLGERITVGMLIGTVLIVLGISLINQRSADVTEK